MYKKLRFKKEDGVWYIDLPHWIGPKHALSMVAGAHRLLDLYNTYSVKKNDIVELYVNTTSHKMYAKPVGFLSLKKEESSLLGGATYRTGIREVPTIWLCPVTLFVLHEYPEVIDVDFRGDFMESSFYYFTYDHCPDKTGPAHKNNSCDVSDVDRAIGDCAIAVDQYERGDSISEIVQNLELPEKEIRKYLCGSSLKYMHDYPQDYAVTYYEEFSDNIHNIAEELKVTEEKVREYLSAGSEKYKQEHSQR